jgi:hypothetical protein
MAKYKVNLVFKIDNVEQQVGETITLSQKKAERFENLGYLTEVKEKAAPSKAAAKGKAAKGTPEADDIEPEDTETK